MPTRTLILTLIALLTTAARGQNEVEYQMEMGGAVGASFYLGDTNSRPFYHTSGMGSFLVRRVFNPRMVLKADLAFGHLGGNTGTRYIPLDADSKTPEGGQAVSYKFGRNVVDLGAQFELNFWGYGMGQGYKGYSRVTPYAVLGAGLTLATGSGGGTKLAFNLPVGVGVKFKLRPRVNIGAEWTVRFTTTDALDVTGKSRQLDDPYHMQSKGFKNKDAYSFLMLFLTYDMCPKYRKCNN